MKRSWIIIAIVVVVIFAIYQLFAGKYNTMVELQEPVAGQWGQVENAYQSRMDKTKVIVEIVKGAAEFEKSTLTAVIEARANATKVTINPDKLTPENIEQYQKAQDSYGSALSRLMVVAEQYPQLKATEAFRDFQSQYEGMENRIAFERNKFNEIVQKYNTYIRKFPNNFIAAMFDFEKKGYFAAAVGADKAPDVKF